MQFTTETQNGFNYIHISGNIESGVDAAQFYVFILERLRADHKVFIVSLQGVEHINSCGMGMLFSASSRVRDAGGKMVLCHFDQIQEVSLITHVNRTIEHYPTEAEACYAVGAPLPTFGSATS